MPTLRERLEMARNGSRQCLGHALIYVADRWYMADRWERLAVELESAELAPRTNERSHPAFHAGKMTRH